DAAQIRANNGRCLCPRSHTQTSILATSATSCRPPLRYPVIVPPDNSARPQTFASRGGTSTKPSIGRLHGRLASRTELLALMNRRSVPTSKGAPSSSVDERTVPSSAERGVAGGPTTHG